MKYLDIKEVSLRKKRINIEYYSNWWRKRIKIPISDISRIELIAPHPISITDNYYVVHTKSGNQYEFGPGFVDSEKIEKYCKEHDIPLLDGN
jgi:hypothetical protein